ncbi:MAG: RluA family pseudouridine synthase, partial [Planctomycetota bacterium]
MQTPPKCGNRRIPADWRGRRLDLTLVDLEPGYNRSRWQAWIKAGHVQLAGETITRPGHPVEGDDTVAWDLPDVPPAQDSHGQVVRKVTILHLDESIVVVDKPAGLLSHRNRPDQAPAVPELLATEIGALPEGPEPGRPGVVHRLDRGTSGVMVLARTAEAMEALMHAFAERQVEKVYAALCLGVPRFESEWIHEPIERDPRKPDRRRIAAPGEGKEASTLMKCVERYGQVACLVNAEPKTGRTHQIRVHLAARGLPILGDVLYRPRSSREKDL